MNMNGDIGGVTTHSTANFWDEYDIFRLDTTSFIRNDMALRDILQANSICHKRMVSATRNKHGFTSVEQCILMNRAEANRFWKIVLVAGADQIMDNVIADTFWRLSAPVSHGGGASTRVVSEMDWTAPAGGEGKALGHVIESNADEYMNNDLCFNDYKQKKYWTVTTKPIKLAKPRSIGKSQTTSVGHRYGSNVHA